MTKSVSQGLACFLRPDKVKTSAQNSDKAQAAERACGKRDGKMERRMEGERGNDTVGRVQEGTCRGERGKKDGVGGTIARNWSGGVKKKKASQ